MPRYEFSEGSSNKFWQIELKGSSFTTTYGKIGTDGSATTKKFASAAEAKKEYEKLIAEKVKKGYELAEGDGDEDEDDEDGDEEEEELGDDADLGDDDGDGGEDEDAADFEDEGEDEEPAPKRTAAKAPARAVPAKVAAPAKAAPAKVAAGGGGPRYFEFVEGSSSKFWEITLLGTSFTTRYGKIGTDGQKTIKEYDSAGQATKEYEKVVAEKTRKGYEEIAGGGKAKASAKGKPAKAAQPADDEGDDDGDEEEPAAPPKKAAAGGSTAERRFELEDDSSSKFWAISRSGNSFTTRWGKIGTDGTQTTKKFGSAAETQKEYDKLVAEKTKKGYEEVSGGGGGGDDDGDDGDDDGDDDEGGEGGGASNKDLEKAILADPDNKEAYLVYADWLQGQGDPRGELIAVQAKGNLQAKVNDIIAKNAEHFYGELSESIGGVVTVEWHLGFIKTARIGLDEEGEASLSELTEQLLALPSARFLQELTFGLSEGAMDGENNYGDVLATLAEKKPKTLRKLFVGDFEYPDQTEMSWSYIGDFGPVWKALPQLRGLILQSGNMELGTIDAPELRELEVRSGGLTAENIKAVGAAKFPKLEKLHLWLGTDSYGGNGTIDDLQNVLDGKGLPKLKHLGLMNSDLTDDLCKVLHKAKILAQLETLDLSMGIMSDAGAAALIENKGAFKHLKRLNVADNCLTDASAKALKGLCADVHFGEQRDGEGDDRYVSVGE